MTKKPLEAGVPDYEQAGSVAESEGGGGWHPELPRVKFEALLGRVILIDEISLRDSTIEEPKEGEPVKQYALVLFRAVDKSVPGEVEGESVVVEVGEQATTATGGVRVVDQLRRTAQFPAKAEVAQERTKRGFRIWVLRAPDA